MEYEARMELTLVSRGRGGRWGAGRRLWLYQLILMKSCQLFIESLDDDFSCLPH